MAKQAPVTVSGTNLAQMNPLQVSDSPVFPLIGPDKPKIGLSLMPTEDFHQAAGELLDADRVDAMEWSFDFAWSGTAIPQWCQDILDKFSSRKSLLGHGVNLSPLSALFSERQRQWLLHTQQEFLRRDYIHATEHFGFSEAGRIAHGAPIAVPMDAESLQKGKDMLKRYADATQCPVGLENLAFAFGMEDVKRQGDFIDQLVSSVDGFVLLDLHNIYCQVVNFGISEKEVLQSYPLAKVREIHLSGGSWSASVSGKRLAVRRDTHDDAVPQEVFDLAALALKLCPSIEFVILERLGGTMMDAQSQQQFRDDFDTTAQILDLCYA